MTTRSPILAAALALAAPAASAQDTPAPAQDNAAQPALPPVIQVPAPIPAPAANEQPAAPEPEEPPPVRPGPRPDAEPAPAAPAAAPAPDPAETAPARLAPTPEPAPVPPPAAAPPVASAPAVPTAPAEEDGAPWPWLLLGAAAVAAALAAGGLFLRRRREEQVLDLPAEAVEPEPEPGPGPEPESAPVPGIVANRARIEVTFRPVRAGLNLVTATAECEFTVANRGDRSARDLRFGALLLSAHAQQDAELAELWAGGVTRPLVPPFALAPGEERTLGHLLTLPRAAIEPLNAGGRPMFVPVVAVSAVYDRGDGAEGQAGRAWVVGVVRRGSPKLAPLWLDEPPRTREDVSARPHAATVER